MAVSTAKRGSAKKFYEHLLNFAFFEDGHLLELHRLMLLQRSVLTRHDIKRSHLCHNRMLTSSKLALLLIAFTTPKMSLQMKCFFKEELAHGRQFFEVIALPAEMGLPLFLKLFVSCSGEQRSLSSARIATVTAGGKTVQISLSFRHLSYMLVLEEIHFLNVLKTL